MPYCSRIFPFKIKLMTENETKNPEEKEEKSDEKPTSAGENNLNTMSALAYILFFIPMLTHRENKFAMFHANQGLVLFITVVIINVVGGMIPIIGWFILLPLGYIFILIMMILGIINALGGKKKKLPLIGGFKIIE